MRKVIEISQYDLPVHVLEDINKRITDWVSSGGKEEDDYVQRQIAYAEKCSKLFTK